MHYQFCDTMIIPALLYCCFFITVASITVEEDFEYLQRRFNGEEWITSEIPEIQQEREEWPDDFYSLLMSKHGCPVGRWNMGYLSFTWKSSQMLLSHEKKGQCDDYNKSNLQRNNTHCRLVRSEESWPNSPSNLFGPYQPYKMKLNFCQRSTSSERDEVNKSWPQESFRLFDAKSRCPEGFHHDSQVLTLPPVRAWTVNGYLPSYDIVVNDSNNTVVTLGICVREVNVENNATTLPSTRDLIDETSMDNTNRSNSVEESSTNNLNRNDAVEENLTIYFNGSDTINENSTNFFNGSDTIEENSTNYFNGSDTIEEYSTTYFNGSDIVEEDSTNYFNGSDTVEHFSANYFKTNKSAFIFQQDSEKPCPHLDAYTVTSEIISLADTNKSITNVTTLFQLCFYEPSLLNARDDDNDETEDIEGYELTPFDILYTGHNGNKDSNSDHVYTHAMYCTESTVCWTILDLGRTLLVSELNIRIASSHSVKNSFTYKAYVSNDKWTLVKYGGIELSEMKYAPSGRYILLTIPHHTSKNTLFRVNVAVKRQQPHMCMVDLGIADGSIKSEHISLSNQHEFNVTILDSNSPRWCVKQSDENSIPYIQVDLQHELLLDGITIYNWFNTIETITNGEYTMSYVPMGVKSFSVSFSSDRNHSDVDSTITFHLELFRRVDEPQTFIFLKQMKARYVRIHLLESMSPGYLCVDFELHGCRQKGTFYNPVFLSHNTEIDAVQTLTSPTIITNIGYPSSYHEGTSYTWIIDFRNIGYIKLIFKEILLQVYQDRSHPNLQYFCADQLQVSDLQNSVWNVPSGDERKHVVMATQEKYLIIAFRACKPYLQRIITNGYFFIYVSVADQPTCSLTDQSYTRQKCELPTMLLSSGLLKNIRPDRDGTESWEIKVPKHVLHVVFTYFHILCDDRMKFEIKNRYSDAVTYSNCVPPPPVVISESDIITLSLNIRSTPDSMTEFGFLAIYTAVNNNHNDLINTFGHDYFGYTKIKFSNPYYSVAFNNGTTFLVYKACSETLMECYSIFSGNPISWSLASEDCWIRGKKMVSIKTKKKLHVINYILRSFLDELAEDGSSGFHSDIVDPNYFSHIGIKRVTNADGIEQFVWIDGSPVQFSAWNSEQPNKRGDCVRTSFYLENTENTWEVEDCVKQLSLFHVCEEPVEKLPLQELHSNNPKTYSGKRNTTKSGQTCQRWDTDWPHEPNESFMFDENFPEKNISAANNYCRDPSKEGFLWCYTTNPLMLWERCFKNSLGEWDFSTYSGYVSTTITGRTCQRWDSRLPHSHNKVDNDAFPDDSVKDASNYCRDPMREENSLWCYTTDPKTRWDFCRLIDTVSDRCYRTHSIYSGTLNVTYSGIPCQRWDASSPHVTYPYDDSVFPEGNVSLSENYCRDPDGEGFSWCYTVDPDVRWECCNPERDEANHYSMAVREKDIFTCDNGTKISIRRVCNAIVDCIDYTDETDCEFRVHNLSQQLNKYHRLDLFVHLHTYFKCDNNEIISLIAKCDDVVDCVDGSDEKHCNRETSGCLTDEYRCGDGRCISLSLVCDFIPHCNDNADEFCDYPDCKNNEYECENGQCIPFERRCNAHIDCIDGSDEQLCDACDVGVAFHCDVTRCITKRQVCDGFPDCNDEKDETQCTNSYYQTCEDRWKNGLDKNGKYNISERTLVECNYDDVEERKIISTIFKSVENVATFENNMHVDKDTFPVVILDTHTAELLELYADYEYSCSQTFTQTCKMAVQESFDAEIRFFENVVEQCRCIALTVSDVQVFGFVHSCNDTDILLEDSLMHVTYEWFYPWSLLRKKNSFDDHVRIQIGPVICKKEIVYERNFLQCGDSSEYYPISMHCIYDTDINGRLLGCRYGFHLQDCDNVLCPNGTVKCPRSYCIPLNFICDGINQCQGGEDEFGCGCSNNALEVLFLLSEDEFQQHHEQVKQIAYQFNSRGSIVRLLYYRAFIDELPFEHQILEITDTEIDGKDIISVDHECKYRILASEFVHRVNFKNSSTRGIIFFQNDTNSAITGRHIFQSVFMTDIDLYRIIFSFPDTNDEVDAGFSHVTDIKVRNLHTIASMASRMFPFLCKDALINICPGLYRCSSSSICIELKRVCDGYAHCPLSDDEMFCDFECPSNCSCTSYSVDCSENLFENITDITLVDKRVRALDLHSNHAVSYLFNTMDIFIFEFPVMINLNLSNCDIKQLSSGQFRLMPNLRKLDLSLNKIIKIPRRAFYGLTKLVQLNLLGNDGLISFESNAFYGLVSLKEFVIVDSSISLIATYAFSGLSLETLHICYNYIHEISAGAFSDLSVRTIIFEGNTLVTFNEGIFNGILNLESLRSSAYKYCCVRPQYLPEKDCLPEKDEFSSCDDLMRNSTLRIMLWVMGICALLGNVLAIIYRIVLDRERLKLGYGIFVTNLAVSDLFMGVYLLIIAIADTSYRNRYIFMDEYWRNSVWCSCAGVLSTLSSEASVLFLCLITLDRVIVIKSPFSALRFTSRKAITAATLAWIVSFSISVTPLFAADYFENKFYSKSGVCVALPLTRDRPPGWLYSVIVFIGVNFVTFIVIAFGQMSIYLEIKAVSSKISKKRSGRSKANRRRELLIARNLLMVVATDFFCWFPVGCMGMLAMNGHVIPGDVYAWVAVFILPVNSALNPIIYTLTSIRGRRKQQETTSSSTTLKSRIVSSQRINFHEVEKLVRYFVFKKEESNSTLVSLESLIQRNESISLDVLLMLTSKLTKCLMILHKHAMVIENLNADCLFVTKIYGKINSDVLIRQHVTVESSSEKKQENIYKLGVVLRRLIMCYTNTQ
ncbi:hypothetical protein ACF0H5_003596 [Mactra antiquata]